MNTPREIMEASKARMIEKLPMASGPYGRHAREVAMAEHTYKALAVVILDEKIRAFLEASDPQALGQARAAAELWRDHHENAQQLDFTAGDYRD